MTEKGKINADARLKTIVENGAKLGHRSLLVVLDSDKAEQVMIIHHLLSKAVNERPSVLWCHKKGSDVPRQNRKELKKLEKNLKSGKCDISSENAFHLFLLATPIKYCAYSDSKSVLGSTYGMCVLQDFHGLTPNVLCRVVETVKGGGVIVILLNQGSLRDLFDLEMDVHSRLKTYSHPTVTPLFNERFVLSLGRCKSYLVLNNELQVVKELPSLARPVQPASTHLLEKQEEALTRLRDLQTSLEDAEKPLPQLISCCKTVDQAKAVLKMIDVITDKGGKGTVSVTSGRGRGKSAALGLAVSAAVHFGLNNIFVTSPSPDNLGTFFEFIFKGFDALDYKEGEDYEIIQSTNVEYNNAIVRVSVFREYRQTIQYIEPNDAKKLSQAELIVIDEAAAIPLPFVKALLGPYNVFMASTINGYEGTGRSLSLKLLNQLRRQTVGTTDATNSAEVNVSSGQALHEVSLKESIRYRDSDPVEIWLHDLLCLYASSTNTYSSICPPPQSCQLYYVNREVLLSGHEESENFLNEVVSLLVASHYRNSPDDLQILSDAPAHHLFVLLTPILPGMTSLPTVLAVIQVCMEGNIDRATSNACKKRGERPSGDLVPWSLASQFLNTSLTELVGVRVIRIATHPDYQSMGYGSRAMSLLTDYYKGKHISLDDEQDSAVNQSEDQQKGDFIVPRHSEKPLLSKLGERTPEAVDYLSVSYGVTEPLFKFWRRAGFIPLYISQVSNKVTGEHNCVMISPLIEEGDQAVALSGEWKWVRKSSLEFLRRFLDLSGGPLRDLPPSLALSIIQSHDHYLESKEIDWEELQLTITGHDIQRIERYAKNLADRNLMCDLFPAITYLYFMKRFPAVHLSLLQANIFVGIGLQARTFDELVKIMDLPIESLLGQLNRGVRRFLKALTSVQETSLARQLPSGTTGVADFVPVDISLEQDLEQAAKDYEFKALDKSSAPASLRHLGDLSKFAIQGDDSSWQTALENTSGDVVTIKNLKKPSRMTEEELDREIKESLKESLEPPTKKKKGFPSSKKKGDFQSKKGKGDFQSKKKGKGDFSSKKNKGGHNRK